jgi:hypothetical protein
MKRMGIVFLGIALFAGYAVARQGGQAQPQGGAQAGAQTNGQANAQASKQGAQGNANGAAASSAAAQTKQGSAALANGSTFNAALNAPVDSKKAKPGDPVTAHTTEPKKCDDGKTVMPKGTKLMGHVTQASARGNGESESALGIVFDKAILKNGQEIPLNAGIQALASGQSAASAAGPDLDGFGGAGATGAGSGRAGGGRSSGGALGGVTSTAGGAAGAVTNTAANVGGTAGGALNSTANVAGNATSSANGVAGGAAGGLNTAGQLASNSRGVFGLNGLNLNSAAMNSSQGSIITSAGKNVHLDSGTQMLLVSQAAAGAQGESKQPAAEKSAPKSERKPEPERPNRP